MKDCTIFTKIKCRDKYKKWCNRQLIKLQSHLRLLETAKNLWKKLSLMHISWLLDPKIGKVVKLLNKLFMKMQREGMKCKWLKNNSLTRLNQIKLIPLNLLKLTVTRAINMLKKSLKRNTFLFVKNYLHLMMKTSIKKIYKLLLKLKYLNKEEKIYKTSKLIMLILVNYWQN